MVLRKYRVRCAPPRRAGARPCTMQPSRLAAQVLAASHGVTFASVESGEAEGVCSHHFWLPESSRGRLSSCSRYSARSRTATARLIKLKVETIMAIANATPATEVKTLNSFLLISSSSRPRTFHTALQKSPPAINTIAPAKLLTICAIIAMFSTSHSCVPAGFR